MAQLSSELGDQKILLGDCRRQRRPADFRLSTDARLIDFHQKTLLYDEFGMGWRGYCWSFFHALRRGRFRRLNDQCLPRRSNRLERHNKNISCGVQGPPSRTRVECKVVTRILDTLNNFGEGLDKCQSLVFGAGARGVVTLW